MISMNENPVAVSTSDTSVAEQFSLSFMLLNYC